MRDSQTPLPSYENPPVVEVALTVQFEPLNELRTSHLGLLWERFKDEFPRTEDRDPAPPKAERFEMDYSGRPQVQVQWMQAPPVPRVWFLNESGTQLIQVQKDRFTHNWRKVGEGEEYPRYDSIRSKFIKELESIQEFVSDHDLGDLKPTQCEVTYLNHIEADSGGLHSSPSQFFPSWQPQYSDDFLTDPDEVRMNLRWVIRDDAGSPIGRMYVDLHPAFRTRDRAPIYVLQLTVRGAPLGGNISGNWVFS